MYIKKMLSLIAFFVTTSLLIFLAYPAHSQENLFGDILNFASLEISENESASLIVVVAIFFGFIMELFLFISRYKKSYVIKRQNPFLVLLRDFGFNEFFSLKLSSVIYFLVGFTCWSTVFAVFLFAVTSSNNSSWYEKPSYTKTDFWVTIASFLLFTLLFLICIRILVEKWVATSKIAETNTDILNLLNEISTKLDSSFQSDEKQNNTIAEINVNIFNVLNEVSKKLDNNFKLNERQNKVIVNALKDIQEINTKIHTSLEEISNEQSEDNPMQ